MKKGIVGVVLFLLICNWGASEKLTINLLLNKTTGVWKNIGIENATQVQLELNVKYATQGIEVYAEEGKLFFLNPSGNKTNSVAQVTSISFRQDNPSSSNLTANDNFKSQMYESGVSLNFSGAKFELGSENKAKKMDVFLDNDSVLSVGIHDGGKDYRIFIDHLSYTYKDLYKTWWGDTPGYATKGLGTLWKAIASGDALQNIDVDETQLSSLKANQEKNGILPNVIVGDFKNLAERMYFYQSQKRKVGFLTADMYLDRSNPFWNISGDEDKQLAGKGAKYLFTYKNATQKNDFEAINQQSGEAFLQSSWQRNFFADDLLSRAYVATLSLKKVEQNGSLTSQELASTDFFFLPGGSNQISSKNLSNVIVPQEVLWDNPLGSGLTQKTFEFDFQEPVVLQYLTVLTSKTITTSNIKISDQDGKILTDTYTYQNGGPLQTKVFKVFELIADGNSKKWKLGTSQSGKHFFVLQLPKSATLQKLKLTYDSPDFTVYKISGHNFLFEGNDLSFEVTQNNDSYQIRSGKVPVGNALIVTQNSLSGYLSFWDYGYGSVKQEYLWGLPTSKSVVEKMRPIKYSWGGWETPRSFSEKVILNQTNTAFPKTEIDLVQDARFNSSGLYIAPQETLRDSEKMKPFQFGFGVRTSYASSTMLNPRSPFFVEKWAGVDSIGLIQSLLFANGSTLLDDYANQRWKWRTQGASTDILKPQWTSQDIVPFSGANFSWYTSARLSDWIVNGQDWILNNTKVVGSLKNMKVGNILVGKEGNEVNVALIVEVPQGLSDPNSTNLADWFSGTKVLSISKSLGALTLSSWAEFTLTPKNYHVRSLTPNRDSSVDLNFNGNSAFNTDTKQRVVLIPNTEELVPIGLDPTGTEKDEWQSGIMANLSDQSKGNPRPWDLAAFDENFVANDQRANIYNNKQTIFYLVAGLAREQEKGLRVGGETLPVLSALVSDPKRVVLAEIKNLSGSSNGQMEIRWIKDDPQYYPQTKFSLSYQDGRFFVNVDRGNGKVSYGYFSIVAVNPYQGDDIRLEISVNGKILYKSSRIVVYDKKMLWRANLYLNEGSGGLDWNNRHPWITGNDWNRYQDGKTPFSGLNDLIIATPENVASLKLPVLAGGQVVLFPQFTPLRSLSTPPLASNYLGNTVAYSFPKHAYEPIQTLANQDGDAGSMDSPFDFNKKMLLQQAWMGNLYNDSGKKFAITRLQWPNGMNTKLDDFPTWESFKTCVTGATNEQTILPSSQFSELNSNSTNWKTVVPESVIKPWGKTFTPNNSWWSYNAEKSPQWSDTNHSPSTNAFIPSLGLRIKSSDNAEGNSNAALVELFTNSSNVIEAGTDCIGFAQRSASWQSNPYLWQNITPGWTEQNSGTGMDNIWDQLKVYEASSTRSYVGQTNKVYSDEDNKVFEVAYSIVHNRSSTNDDSYLKTKGSLSSEEKEILLNRLKLVSPGDIWVKDSTGDNNTQWDDHIAIVASVPNYVEGMTVDAFMDQMILIEGEYNSEIQSVIKKLSVGDYNKNSLVEEKNIYVNYSIPQDGPIDGLRCASWAIRRLK